MLPGARQATLLSVGMAFASYLMSAQLSPELGRSRFTKGQTNQDQHNDTVSSTRICNRSRIHCCGLSKHNLRHVLRQQSQPYPAGRDNSRWITNCAFVGICRPLGAGCSYCVNQTKWFAFQLIFHRRNFTFLVLGSLLRYYSDLNCRKHAFIRLFLRQHSYDAYSRVRECD